MVALGVGLGIITGISLKIAISDEKIIETVHAEPVATTTEEKEVQIEIVYNWTEQRIIEEIKQAFPEDPETALKVARCESSYKMIQSHHVRDGMREMSFGIFQVHQPSWDRVAMKLGYEDYKTDIKDNLAMARYIYDNAGKQWTDWSCYSQRMI